MKALRARVEVTVGLNAAAEEALKVRELEALIEGWFSRLLVGQTVDTFPNGGRLVVAAVEVPMTGAVDLVETVVVPPGPVGS